ncbi:multiheme c-type cytochrome [Gemmata sp. JC717]|uniref:tetratricopeptide repeat protein n=1 Tax=Gemmata algarum TaxID=2975278 RepID=UPI0021BA644E|nr:multiheme c-type cytochrome [Gemmata algarum]MDY3556666.1 multiheme c-type cytochrome [Gemmata algarum]
MDTSPAPAETPVVVVRRPVKPFRPYQPAIGPKLRVLLLVVFGTFAFLGATGVYLAAVSVLNYVRAPQSYTTPFGLWVFLAHIAVGVLGTFPFVAFGAYHWVTARKRENRVAVRLGVLLFALGLLVCVSGFALVQLDGLPQLPTGSASRAVAYWLHIALPAGAVWAYVAHRRAGPPIKWRLAKAWGGAAVAFTGVMVVMHAQDPRTWFREGPKEGAQYFEPSMTRTADGKFISADVLMMDSYCAKCHQDVANDHFHSAHKFSSFNNPAYLFSVRETRKVGLEKDGTVKSSRWCAGCHDIVPFVSGAFDDPNYDDVNDRTAHAGITCTVCHAITHVNGTFGNGAYTIEEPPHYPFAQSTSPLLQWVNNQMVKAKPDFHKQTFLKPFHKTAEFCSTCHKVSLPVELNHYKEFLRGQNHYDSYLLSGVSGHGVRSFYYPPQAKENCAACHMPVKPSADFGAKDFDNSGTRKVHNHRFPGANTGLFTLLKEEPRYAQHADGFQQTIDMHAKYLRGTAADGSDKKVRVDIFGVKGGNALDPAALVAPLRPQLPALKPGKTYTVEVVVRTLGLGHHFSQGTVDSNEIWVDFRATSGGVEIARNGALAGPNETGEVDRWAHYINVHMLDRDGNRVNRRNPQDIFTPLYDKQIPPGAAAVMHYRIDVPENVPGPIELTAKVRYRKFDYEYMKLVHGGKEPPKLPIVDLCEDAVTLPVEGRGGAPEQASPVKPAWQRWNDYGIACLLEGGGKRGHFKQAEAAFKTLTTLGGDAVAQGHLNLARVYIEEGRFDEAARALDAAGKCDPPAAPWSRAWFTALVNNQNATRKEHFDAVITDVEKLLDPAAQPRDRGFDFTKDYVVWNTLANWLFKRRTSEEPGSEARRACLVRAIKAAERALALEAEDVAAHDLLALAYGELGGELTVQPAVTVTPAWALGEVAAATDPKQPAPRRVAAGANVAAAVPQLPAPKLATVREALEKLRAAFHAEADAEVRAALAAALAKLHRESHAIYKPDEIARSTATRIYRAKNPAANYAAGDRVIYPTTPAHRDAIVKSGELPPAK